MFYMYSKSDLNLSPCCMNNNLEEQIPSKDMTEPVKSNGENSREPPNVDLSWVKKEIKKEEVMAIRTRFPNKIPVIVQKYWKENELPQLDKSKFLVPQDITMSQFQTIIRNRMHMGQSQALYLLVNERSMLSLSLTLGEVYTEHAGPNGFLYITYASQEVFGGGNVDSSTLPDKNGGDVDTCSSASYSTKYFAREYEDIIYS